MLVCRPERRRKRTCLKDHDQVLGLLKELVPVEVCAERDASACADLSLDDRRRLDTVVEDNGAPEMLTFGGGIISCTRCTVQDDNGVAVLPVRTGYISLTDSTVSTGGGTAVFAAERATVYADNTDVSANSIALYADENSEIYWTEGQVDGSIYADLHSHLYLTGVTQTANPIGNLATDDSHLKIVGGEFLGDTLLSGFSDGTAEGSPIFDTISCDRGGDLYCDGSEAKTSSSCGLCP